MASLNLAGKTSGYVKVTAPDDSSNNPTVVLPKESGELALKSDIGEGGGGTGGGVEAQPPVAFNLGLNEAFDFEPVKGVDIPFDKVDIDTDNGSDSIGYVAQKDGIYNLSYSVLINSEKPIELVQVAVYNGANEISYSSEKPPLADATSMASQAHKANNTFTVELKKGEVLKLRIVQVRTTGTGTLTVGVKSHFSGHMVSSITEGEVKEKEAVVSSYSLTNDFDLGKLASFEVVKFDTKRHDENNYYDSTTGKFQPTIAGYYFLTATLWSTNATVGERLARLISVLDKNGDNRFARGSEYDCSSTEGVNPQNISSVCSGAIYLNGTTDYVECKGYISSGDSSTINPVIAGSARNNHFSAHLITGQSSGGGSGGDSIWTEEDGKAVYGGDIKVNGVVVGSRGIDGGTDTTNNTVVGRNALTKSEATEVTAIGASALQENRTGNWNVAIGVNALKLNETGGQNVAIGDGALWENVDGDKNIAIGKFASKNNTSGAFNIAIGDNSQANATGIRNIAIGTDTALKVSGEQNIILGHTAGQTLTPGENNILIGSSAEPSSPTVSNEIVLGGTDTGNVILNGEVQVNVIRKPNGDLRIITKAGTTILAKEDGLVSFPNYTSASTTATPNMVIQDNGIIRRTSATLYSAEEVDTKLAIKDKLIEKLSKRLDSLEKKLKKAK